GYRHSGSIVPGWRIVNRRVRIDWKSVDNRWLIDWNINNIRAGWFNHDYISAVASCLTNLLLRRGLQVTLRISFGAHALDGIHHIRLLSEKSVPQICCPLDVTR